MWFRYFYSKAALMNKDKFQSLLEKYEKGELSTSEEQIVQNFFKFMEERNYRPDGWNAEMKDQLRTEIFNNLSNKLKLKGNKRTSFMDWRIAASIVLLLSFAFIILKVYNPFNEHLNSLTTGYGEKSTILLQDGSVIHLNASSTLKHPDTFDGKNTREVIL